ncbi:MAG: helix-turn-helix domain-containing protein [Bacteroidota bacterium]
MSSHGYAIIPDHSFLLSPAPLMLFFPTLYFYTQDLVQPNKISFVERLLHFLPFIILYVMGTIVGMDAPMATLKIEANAYFMITFIVANLLVTLLYSFFIFRLVRLNQNKYQNDYANNNMFLSLSWIQWMVSFLILMPFFGISGYLLCNSPYVETKLLVISISMLLAMLILAFFTYRQPTLYREEELDLEILEANIAAIKATKQNTKPTISDEERLASIAKIESYFSEAKPYLDPKIRMPELARALNIPRHVFSSIINEHYQMNFFNLINQYRVEHAKALLRDKKNQFYTLETIGEMAGFNSRSTFNKRFKEFTGMSPKEYQQDA